MSTKQYMIVLDLYHNYKEAFDSLKMSIKEDFFSILYRSMK